MFTKFKRYPICKSSIMTYTVFAHNIFVETNLYWNNGLKYQVLKCIHKFYCHGQNNAKINVNPVMEIILQGKK